MASSSARIVLTTLNAKYIHASLGLRYLMANMGELRAQTVLREFTTSRKTQDVVDELLLALGALSAPDSSTAKPLIIGFGVYIWNMVQTTEVLRLLNATRPDITLILGGPEVSYETEVQDIVRHADHVITGWGDLSFADLCRALLRGAPDLPKVIAGKQPPLDQIVLPYNEYSDADLAHRVLYVEASRGCPFSCEFCLSALDKTAWAFDLDAFLQAMARLYQRGARTFKFVDRTFNLKVDSSIRILHFFLDQLPATEASTKGNALFVHFELVPDHLPEALKAIIAQFPPGVLQFEVGIQTFDVSVQQRISRRQNNEKAEANLRWLVQHSNAHLHTDLLFGLPGETLAGLAAGFDRLLALQPDEIQVGILKRLRGTPIIRHASDYGMKYATTPPYAVLETSTIDAETMQRLVRFARYWDMLANSGRFKQTLPLLLDTTSLRAKPSAQHSPFFAFMAFADWLWHHSATTTGLSPEHLVDALFAYLDHCSTLPVTSIRAALINDYAASGARGSPQTLRGMLPRQPPGPARKTLIHRQEHHLRD